MSSYDKPNPLLQQVPLIITPNKFTTTKPITLPFEFRNDLQLPTLDEPQLKQRLQRDIDNLNELKTKLDLNLKSTGEYKQWENKTLNSIAPGLFDDKILIPQHHNSNQPDTSNK